MARMPTAFDNFTFPDYEFVEYPKWVTPTKGKPILVNNKREEKELLEEGAFESKPEPDQDERSELMERAEKLGLTINKTWGVAKIRAFIEETEKK